MERLRRQWRLFLGQPAEPEEAANHAHEAVDDREQDAFTAIDDQIAPFAP